MSTLKAIRRAAGLTQIQLSQKANVSRFRLALAETGSLELRPEELTAINKAVAPEMEKTARVAMEFKNLAAVGA